MKKTLAVIAATGALLAGSAAPAATTGPAAAPAPVTAPAALPACESEDYAGPVACRWDATARGNGTGLSFTWDGEAIHYAAPGLDAELQKCADVFLPVDADTARYDFCYATALDVAAFTYTNV